MGARGQYGPANGSLFTPTEGHKACQRIVPPVQRDACVNHASLQRDAFAVRPGARADPVSSGTAKGRTGQCRGCLPAAIC